MLGQLEQPWRRARPPWWGKDTSQCDVPTRGWILSFSPTDGPSPSDSLGFSGGRDAEGPAGIWLLSLKTSLQHCQRSCGFFPHFPPLWQFCGSAQLFVALLILPVLLASLLLSPSPCARLLLGELRKQQGLRPQPPFWAEIRGFVVFQTELNRGCPGTAQEGGERGVPGRKGITPGQDSPLIQSGGAGGASRAHTKPGFRMDQFASS